MNFFFEVLIGGLLSGVMYALVALGFVMIYKASGVFNFAQGAMVYLAALSVVGCMEKGAPLWLAIILAFAILPVSTVNVPFLLTAPQTVYLKLRNSMLTMGALM